jgi:hypothetical protein
VALMPRLVRPISTAVGDELFVIIALATWAIAGILDQTLQLPN